MSRKWTRILIVSISVWDSLGTWLLGSKQTEKKAICSSQTLQPQGSLSGVQALDLMEVIQIQDVSDITYQCFSMKLLFIIMDQMNCIAKSNSFFLPLLPLCFYSPCAPVLLYFIAPLLVFSSSCAILICLKFTIYLPNLNPDLLLCHFSLRPSISTVRLSSLLVKHSLGFVTERENIGLCHELIQLIVNFAAKIVTISI